MAEQDPTLEGADNPERPEWLPEKFESAESLAKSYLELERRDTQRSQELAEERRARETLEESFQTLSQQFEAQSRPDPANVYGQWQDQYEADPFGTTLSLIQALGAQNAQQQSNAQTGVDPTEFAAFVADQSLGRKYEDWGEYAPKVSEFLAENPNLFSEDTWKDPRATELAADRIYKMVKAEEVLSGADIAQQQQADTRQMKLNAQSAAGASGRTPALPDEVQEWERIKNAGQKQYWQ